MAPNPTFINLPPPPSDPVTPSDIPGTPNSATTSISELSTVAIKDGHRGHLGHSHRGQTSFPDAERADRISRLAGLERVATARQGSSSSNLAPGQTFNPNDPSAVQAMARERSTVGSASATGSVGGRTTWASGSDVFDENSTSKASEAGEGDVDAMDTSSVGGMSDEQNSLVGFGEGARTPARQSYGSPIAMNKNLTPTPGGGGVGFGQGQSGMSGLRGESMTPVNAQTAAEQYRARMLDGQTQDGSDTSAPRGGARGEAEQILRDRIGDAGSGSAMSTPERGGNDLGRFEFEGQRP